MTNYLFIKEQVGSSVCAGKNFCSGLRLRLWSRGVSACFSLVRWHRLFFFLEISLSTRAAAVVFSYREAKAGKVVVTAM